MTIYGTHIPDTMVYIHIPGDIQRQNSRHKRAIATLQLKMIHKSQTLTSFCYLKKQRLSNKTTGTKCTKSGVPGYLYS